MSYRARLAIGYLAIVALFALTWAWSLFGPLTNAVIEQQQDNLLAVAQAGSITLAQSDAASDAVIKRLAEGTNLRLTVVESDGTVLADSDENPSQMENHGDRPEIASALAGETGTDRRVSSTQNTERIYLAVPATYEQRPVALRVSASLEEVNAVASNARRAGLILLALALIAAASLVSRLTALATDPIMRLTEAAERMASGNLDSAVPLETGQLRILSTALIDLQDQMRHRLSELEAEKGNLNAVLDGLSEAVFLLQGGTVAFTNRAADAFFTRPGGGWTGRDYRETGLPASLLGAIARSDETSVDTAEEVGPDPTGRYLRVTVLRLGPADASDRMLVSVADVTERTRIDMVRRDFVANASHELKTPVAGIRLLAESAGDAASDGDVDQALSFAVRIAAESERLGRIVHDLLDLSRLEAAASPKEISDLRGAVDNALLTHGIAASQRGLELIFDDSSAAGRDAYVRADATDLAVALDNLLDNAITYTEQGSVRVSLTMTSDKAILDVTDTGIGIPAEHLGRIFERFYRVDPARSRDSGGTGLGLALVRHVVERSDGSVEVSSQLGSGTTVRVVLPLT